MSRLSFSKTDWKRIRKLEKKFIGYRIDITANDIIIFLEQFEQHWEIAFRLLEETTYFNRPLTIKIILQLGKLIKDKTNEQLTEVYFCPMNISPGTSADWVTGDLRIEMRLDDPQYNEKFFYTIELDEKFGNNLDHKDIIFVDDMIGSGSQLIDFWENNVRPYYNENNTYHVAVLLAYEQAIREIKERKIPLNIISSTRPMNDIAKVFNNKNKLFSEEEKEILKQFCRNVVRNEENAYGFRDTQSLIIFYTRAPNNSLPIFYSHLNEWIPLFPRSLSGHY